MLERRRVGLSLAVRLASFLEGLLEAIAFVLMLLLQHSDMSELAAGRRLRFPKPKVKLVDDALGMNLAVAKEARLPLRMGKGDA